MFGDSPLDYMSDEEVAAWSKEQIQRDKLENARRKKQRLRSLQSYSKVELEAELRRRDKLGEEK